MSVAEQLKNLFSKKEPDFGMDSQLSLGTPDASVDPIATVQMPNSTSQSAADPARAASVKEAVKDADDQITLPVLGAATVVQHQRRLSILLGLSLLALIGVTVYALNQTDKVAQQLGATGQSLMQSQRLAKSVSQALVGAAQAFPDVSESSGVLGSSVRGLTAGDATMSLSALDANYALELEKITPLVERAEKNAAIVMAQQKILTQVGSALRLINRQSSDLLEIAETVSSLKLQQNAVSTEISAAGQLVMLTQRIGKSSNEFLTVEGVSPEAVFLLGKDLNSFREIAQGMLDGSPELRLSASKDPQMREQLQALIALFEETRTQAGAILGNLQGLVSAREAQSSIIADSEPLRRGLEELQVKLSTRTGLGVTSLLSLAGAALISLLCAVGLSYVQLLDSRKRQSVSDDQRRDAELQEQEAKRVNDAN